MPHEWITRPGDPPRDAPEGHAPIAELHLWPFRSLPKRGFAFVIGLAYALLLVPISAFLGTLAIWWLLLPGLAAIGALWWFISKSYRDAEILEELEIWPDEVRLRRHGPHGRHAEWQANPYWVSVQLYPKGGPVENYLTLRGAGREVEIGAFLTEDERLALRDELLEALARAREPAPQP